MPDGSLQSKQLEADSKPRPQRMPLPVQHRVADGYLVILVLIVFWCDLRLEIAVQNSDS